MSRRDEQPDPEATPELVALLKSARAAYSKVRADFMATCPGAERVVRYSQGDHSFVGLMFRHFIAENRLIRQEAEARCAALEARIALLEVTREQDGQAKRKGR